MNLLTIDGGGNHVKILATGEKTPRRFSSGPTLTATRMVSAVKKLAGDWKYDAVSIGYPGAVLRGRRVSEPHNLKSGWVEFEVAFKCPVNLLNDAAMQALGSYAGGKMLFLGLGTGVGSTIEYGLMAAYVEGLSVLRAANIGKQEHDYDAETTPLRDPEHYQCELNLADIAEVWRRGSVIASWLLDLTADALAKDVKLSDFEGRVSDSGEGRWTIKAAIDEGVPVLTTALYERFASRGEAEFQGKLLSAMRYGVRRASGEIRELRSNS